MAKIAGNTIPRQAATVPSNEGYIYNAYVVAESSVIADHFIISALTPAAATANAVDEFKRRLGLFAGSVTLTQISTYPA